MRKVIHLGRLSIHAGSPLRRIQGYPRIDLWQSPNATYLWVGNFGVEWRHS